MTTTKASVPSWHTYTIEKKPVRKHKLGAPDVYPQEKADEDILSTSRIQKGYYFPTTAYEHESLVHQGREAKLGRLDECTKRAAGLLVGSFNRKIEVNSTLDKERKKALKEIMNQPAVPCGAAIKEKCIFFSDLTRGRPFNQLCKKIPKFTRGRDDVMDYLIDFKVPVSRAIWFFQQLAILGAPHAAQRRTRKQFTVTLTELMRKMWFLDDLTASNIYKDRWQYVTHLAKRAFDEGVIERQEFIWELCELFTEFYVKRHCRTYRDKGKIKGIADVKEKPSHLRVFLLFFIEFLQAAVSNIILARRACSMICQKLKIIADLHEYEYTEDSFMQEHPPTPPMNYMIPAPLKRDRIEDLELCEEERLEKEKEKEREREREREEAEAAEKDENQKSTPPAQDQETTEGEGDKDMEREPEMEELTVPPVPENTLPLNILHALAQCKAYRKNLHLLSSIVQYIVVEAPYALIWNSSTPSKKYRNLPNVMSAICGSPLDFLPCPSYELPLPPSPDLDRWFRIVKLRHNEICRRSKQAEQKWSSPHQAVIQYSARIRLCLDVIGTLDNAGIFDPNVIPMLYEQLFNFCPETVVFDFCLKMRLILAWAITAQREGSYRQCLIAKLFHYATMQSGTAYYVFYFHIQEILQDFFEAEGPNKSTRHYEKEFGNTMSLYMEFIRIGLFDHDGFVKDMIKHNEHNFEAPIYCYFPHLRKEVPIETPSKDALPDPSKPIYNHNTVPDVRKHKGLIVPKSRPREKHALIHDEIPYKHLIILQVPLPQNERHRDEANQREMVVHGPGQPAVLHKEDLKNIAREICKIWQKKVYLKFVDTERLWCPKRYTAQRVQETLSKFRTQTYYDQVMICGWCSESYVDMVQQFVTGHSLQMPTGDGLDILCGMLEESHYIFGIFELCESLLPLLPLVEKVIRSLAADVIPGTMSGQLGYVLVSFLCRHWHYFMHSGRAVEITNQLYTLVERMIRAQDYPSTCWGRVIAAFVFHSKKVLSSANLTDGLKVEGYGPDFYNIFNHGNSMPLAHVGYNSLFCKDIFDAPSQELRYYSYHKYKKRLPSFKLPCNRYSFVINAFIAARQCGRDFDRLANLSAFCGHVSAQIPSLANEWIGAVRALCCKGHPNMNSFYQELFSTQEIDILDCTSHYPLATFVMLLGGKYAFSVPKLCGEIIGVVLQPLYRFPNYYGGSPPPTVEAGGCLALHILANLCTASDQPYIMSPHYAGIEERTKLIPCTADENALRLFHWAEMDNVLFPLLVNIGTLQESLKLNSRVRETQLRLPPEVTTTMYSPYYLPIIVSTALVRICEEDWVTMKMFDIVTSREMTAFTSETLKQNGLGQQLLRMGIRRRTEKHIIKKLIACNGTKRTLIDKLLSNMNLWNFRATMLDIVLMIKETTQKSHSGPTDPLLTEIGKCCKEIFVKAFNKRKSRTNPPSPAVMDESFQLSNITNHWLISPLIQMCPRHMIHKQTTFTATVGGKFLAEVAKVLDCPIESKKDRKKISWLLQQQSFLNAIYTSVNVTQFSSDKENRGKLIDSMYKQLYLFMKNFKDGKRKDMMKEKYRREKENITLRLQLVGGFFNFISKKPFVETWTLLLFQMIVHGVISPNYERPLFEKVFDMISTLLYQCIINVEKKYVGESHSGEKKFSYINYALLVRKLKREIMETKLTQQFLPLLHLFPLPKFGEEMIIMEQYVPPGMPPSPPKGSKQPPPSVPTLGVYKGRYSVQLAINEPHKYKFTLFDTVEGAVPFPDQVVRGTWKYSMYQVQKTDACPEAVQYSIAYNLIHNHPYDFDRPTHIWLENGTAIANGQLDKFLAPPSVEVTEPPPSSTTTASTSTTTTTTTTTATTASADTTTTTSPASETPKEISSPQTTTIPIKEESQISPPKEQVEFISPKKEVLSGERPTERPNSTTPTATSVQSTPEPVNTPTGRPGSASGANSGTQSPKKRNKRQASRDTTKETKPPEKRRRSSNAKLEALQMPPQPQQPPPNYNPAWQDQNQPPRNFPSNPPMPQHSMSGPLNASSTSSSINSKATSQEQHAMTNERLREQALKRLEAKSNTSEAASGHPTQIHTAPPPEYKPPMGDLNREMSREMNREIREMKPAVTDHTAPSMPNTGSSYGGGPAQPPPQPHQPPQHTFARPLPPQQAPPQQAPHQPEPNQMQPSRQLPMQHPAASSHPSQMQNHPAEPPMRQQQREPLHQMPPQQQQPSHHQNMPSSLGQGPVPSHPHQTSQQQHPSQQHPAQPHPSQQQHPPQQQDTHPMQPPRQPHMQPPAASQHPPMAREHPQHPPQQQQPPMTREHPTSMPQHPQMTREHPPQQQHPAQQNTNPPQMASQSSMNQPGGPPHREQFASMGMPQQPHHHPMASSHPQAQPTSQQQHHPPVSSQQQQHREMHHPTSMSNMPPAQQNPPMQSQMSSQHQTNPNQLSLMSQAAQNNMHNNVPSYQTPSQHQRSQMDSQAMMGSQGMGSMGPPQPRPMPQQQQNMAQQQQQSHPPQQSMGPPQQSMPPSQQSLQRPMQMSNQPAPMQRPPQQQQQQQQESKPIVTGPIGGGMQPSNMGGGGYGNQPAPMPNQPPMMSSMQPKPSNMGGQAGMGQPQHPGNYGHSQSGPPTMQPSMGGASMGGQSMDRSSMQGGPSMGSASMGPPIGSAMASSGMGPSMNVPNMRPSNMGGGSNMGGSGPMQGAQDMPNMGQSQGGMSGGMGPGGMSSRSDMGGGMGGGMAGMGPPQRMPPQAHGPPQGMSGSGMPMPMHSQGPPQYSMPPQRQQMNPGMGMSNMAHMGPSQGQMMSAGMQQPPMNSQGMGGHGMPGNMSSGMGPSGMSMGINQSNQSMNMAPIPNMGGGGSMMMSSQPPMQSHMSSMAGPPPQQTTPSYMSGMESRMAPQHSMGPNQMSSGGGMMNSGGGIPMQRMSSSSMGMGGPQGMGPQMGGGSYGAGGQMSTPNYGGMPSQGNYQPSQMGPSPSYGPPIGQNYAMPSGGMPQSGQITMQRMPSQGSLGMGGGGNMGQPMGPPMSQGMGGMGSSMGNSGMGGPPMPHMNPAYGQSQQQYMMSDQRMMPQQPPYQHQQQYNPQGPY